MARSTLRYALTLAGMLLVAASITASPVAAEPHGAWQTDLLNGVPAAFTVNDSQQVLLFIWPQGQEGEWRITVKASCTTNDEYSLLAASPQGAVSLTVRCLGPIENGYVYSFTDTKQVLTLLIGDKNTGRVGFVIPQADATFIVMRFSLTGATDALTAAFTLVEKRQKSPTPNAPTSGTKDTLL